MENKRFILLKMNGLFRKGCQEKPGPNINGEKDFGGDSERKNLHAFGKTRIDQG